MTMFHVGQVVVCIDDNFNRSAIARGYRFPVLRGVYTIRSMHTLRDGLRLRFHELRNPPLGWKNESGDFECGFHYDKFRPAVETDISILRSLLQPVASDEVA